jgi:transposase
MRYLFMRDIELYNHVLGLKPPWTVVDYKLNVKEEQVDVFAGHDEDIKWPCPTCQIMLPIYDHTEERTWRHLDTCQFKTIIHARIPRVDCKEHGIHQVIVPWAEDRARFTALFERLAIDVLQECNVEAATRILNISWDEAWHILEKAVQRGLLRKKERLYTYIGVDEKSVAKGHSYFTIVTDLEDSKVVYISEGRTQQSLDGFFMSLTDEQKKNIKGIAMDMWDPYISSVRQHIPDGEKKIVFDRFHIMMHMVKAVDMVRKDEHWKLLKSGDGTLSGSKFLWLYSKENLPDKLLNRFEDLKEMHLKTGRAWAIKENLRELWSFVSRFGAERHWKRWYNWASHSRLEPIIKAAQTIKDHVGNVLTYFTHRITNATSEGMNSKIQTIKKMAYGFRNIENFKASILFHCGGLDLYPETHTNPG